MPKMKATPHISPQGPITKATPLPGDPLRAGFIAETYLEDAQQFNSVRDMLGFADCYQDIQVSVIGSGTGIPPISLYAWEPIYVCGCKKLIRIEICSPLQPEVNILDIVIVRAVCSNLNFINQHNLPGTYAPTDSFRLIEAVRERAKVSGATSHVGNILSSDTFYNADPNFNDHWAKMGIIAVEMEAADLHATVTGIGVEALGIFTVSDSLVTGEVTTTEQCQTAFTDVMEPALPLTQI